MDDLLVRRWNQLIRESVIDSKLLELQCKEDVYDILFSLRKINRTYAFKTSEDGYVYSNNNLNTQDKIQGELIKILESEDPCKGLRRYYFTLATDYFLIKIM